jgi:hypothetical protein
MSSGLLLKLFLSELVCKPFLQVEGILSSEIVLAIKCSTTKIDWSFQLLWHNIKHH